MIHAYTGDGKGKSTAAIGLLIRAFGSGKKVKLIMFDKGSESYRHHELNVFDKLGIEYDVTGLERMKDGNFRFGSTDADIQEAKRGLAIAERDILSNKYDLIVLDEALCAVSFDLLEQKALEELMKKTPGNVELVLTGRCRFDSLFQQCDLVTNMTKIKHYIEKGCQARAGIEY